jgi:hypothetical protein
MNRYIFVLSSSFLTALIAIEAGAQTPQGARIDNPELRAKFERRRQTPQVVPQATTIPILEGSRTTHVWTLEAVIDRGILVSFDLNPESAALLEAAGAQHVGSAEDVGHHTIWGGKYFRLLPLVAATLDDASLQKWVGQPMKIDVAMRSDGRQVALDVRRP